MPVRRVAAPVLVLLAVAAGGAAEARAQSKQSPRPTQSTRMNASDSKGSLVVDFSRPAEAPAEAPAEKEPEAAPEPADHGGPGHLCTTGNVALDGVVLEAAAAYGVDPCLVVAVMGAESGYRRDAVSPKGACGYMQLMPDTARRFGVVDIFDPRQNVHAGTRYLRWLLDRFGGSVELALAGYNAGEGAVERFGMRIPPYFETQNYVRIITRRYATRHAGLAGLGGPAATPPPPAPSRLPSRPSATWRISVSFDR